jgi:hypothetical protein
VLILMHKGIYLLLYTEQTTLTCNQECSNHRSVVEQNRSKVKEKHSRHFKCTQILVIADTFCQMKKTNMKETWKHSHGLTNVSRSTHNTRYFYRVLLVCQSIHFHLNYDSNANFEKMYIYIYIYIYI